MSDDKKFSMFESLDWDKLKDSKDIVSDAVKSVSSQKGPVGAILNQALGLTGSEGEAFSEAVKSYSNAYNPIFSKMIDSLQDDEVREALIKKLIGSHKIPSSVRKKGNR